MPEISRFLGILIYIRYNEHNPPHFHAEYGNYNAAFTIMDIKLLNGKMPSRVKSLIIEWACLHRDELIEDWRLAQKKVPLRKIKGLV